MSARLVQIALRDVRAYGRHGADPAERAHPQPFDIDLRLEASLDASRSSDALADTIDYVALRNDVVRIVETTSFHLLERLGQAILDALLLDDRVWSASVTIAKPHLLCGATPAVTLTASRAREA